MKTVIRGVKIKLYLTNEQKRSIIKHADACRFIWNYYLPLLHNAVSNGKKKPSFIELSSMLTELKKNKDFYWLNKVNRNPLVNILENLSNSYDSYISSYKLNKPIKVNEPKFKSVKRDVLSFKYNHPGRIKLNKSKSKIRLPSIGYVRFRGYRDNFINYRIISVTIRIYPCGDIEASYNVECDNQTPTLYKEIKAIGLDMGVKKFITDSEGGKILPLNIKSDISKLIKIQRKLDNCELKKQNYIKLIKRLRKQHQHITNKRDYFIHHVSNLYLEYKYINIEDLDVIKMTKNISGTVDNPNMDAKRKTLLNKNILENAWSKFFIILEYKVNMRGGEVRKIEPANTSTTCSCCGVIDKSNRVKEVYNCKSCGTVMDADHNAAINIMKRGISIK